MCVSANMSVRWLIMDNNLSDNLHFKVLFFFCHGYEPNMYISAWRVFFFLSICGLAAGHNAVRRPRLWTAVNHGGRRRKMTRSLWALQHYKVSMTHQSRHWIHDPEAEYTPDSCSSQQIKHISLKDCFWSMLVGPLQQPQSQGQC